jgi:hypothetical protein
MKKYRNSIIKAESKGFALIATISVMALLLLIALAMLSLTTIEVRQSNNTKHQEVARANARMALMIALGELQKYTGPDQRVTARAAILEDPAGGSPIANRNWLGVWSTTLESGNQDWPVIGKAPSSGTNGSPYTRPGAYEDLRHTQTDLSGGEWRKELRQTWLVSKRSSTVDAELALNTGDENVIEILGKGTLGEGVSASAYNSNKVLVEKVDVEDSGAYAWYIADNNQKASIDPLTDVDLVDAAFEASPRANPALVKSGADTPFSNFTEDAQKHPGKLITYLTAPLTQGDRASAQELLGEHYHNLTSYSPGLFTDTLGGGLRQDLTPLLLANKGDKTVAFSSSQGSATRTFSSSYPIIPGSNHGVLGPSFGALRNWAQHTYTNLQDAETSFDSSATRMRPTTFWPHNISDGACADASQWAESAPKIHPVMTDCRWHYYFSHHNKRIRTHIIPRVCLWNPYNRELKIPTLSVLMPNPFYGLSHGMHFFPEASHVDELVKKYETDEAHFFTRWIKKSGYVGPPLEVYKMRTNPFPIQRYLAFTLESTTLAAGECHVFSPKVTSPSLSSSSVGLQLYQPTAISSNVLSSSSLQGTDHFYFDHAASVNYEIQNYKSKDSDTGEEKGSKWVKLKTLIAEIDFSRIFDYQPEVVMQSAGKIESFPFVLKTGTSSSLASLVESDQHPTLQLINGGAGGAHSTSYFAYIGDQWRSANQQTDTAFGLLQTFAEAPLKDAPRNHQVGAKMLWLNENNTEGASRDAGWSPLRGSRWGQDHMVNNVAPIANWNVRAQLVTRSPSSQSARRWFMHSMGSWITQFQPYSPQDVNDQPGLNDAGALVKNPFGSSVEFPFNRNVILFDLPSQDYGVLSLARMRHAMLSPYSWSPSYIVTHSLRDMHAPSDYSAHEISVTGSHAGFSTRWDALLGQYQKKTGGHGGYAKSSDSQGLLQIGNQAVTRSVDGASLSSEDDVLAFDVAFEVNQNLWDRFFISGMPLSQGTQSFDWASGGNKPLWNTRYQYNANSSLGLSEAETLVSGADGLETAFWRNAELLKNKAAFNVNSTSVQAWTAFLSGTLGVKRPLKFGELEDDVVSFARHHRPVSAGNSVAADPGQAGAWIGGRKISEDELRTLAEKIVEEVRKRGPFVSVADFVNRRLRDATDETSHMGTLDAAIKATGLNVKFERDTEYQTTAVNSGGGESDNNDDTFRNSYRYSSDATVQPDSQAWGLPGFLTQGDLLEPLAPSISVRGDTFTIRAYGESSENGLLKARAWLEVTVERSPRYVDAKAEGVTGGEGNIPTDTSLILQRATGQYVDGELSETNKKFGRQFVIKSFRWLNSEET